MYRSRIVIDLPSAETDRRRSPIEWLRSLFGAQLDLRTGREELTVGALWLIEGLVEGFAAAGVHDVVTFMVDHQPIYLDAEERTDDLPLIASAAEAAGVLERAFREMHLVLAHRGEALHATIECAIRNGVLLGDAEMTISLASAPRSAPPQHPPQQVQVQAQAPAPVPALPPLLQPVPPPSDHGGELARQELEALTERIADALAGVLVGARVVREPPRPTG
jgi:hypothetical protein